jgi:hypothetical protein
MTGRAGGTAAAAAKLSIEKNKKIAVFNFRFMDIIRPINWRSLPVRPGRKCPGHNHRTGNGHTRKTALCAKNKKEGDYP